MRCDDCKRIDPKARIAYGGSWCRDCWYWVRKSIEQEG